MKRASPELEQDETLDSFYHGRILVIQKKKGYRFSVDAPLLAAFIRTGPADCLLEAGAGNGIISLLLSLRPFRRIVCLEIQPALADLAGRNVCLNRLDDRIKVLEQDLRTFEPKDRFDVVFSNPPYIRKEGGQPSRSPERAVAKHEIWCDIFDIMQLAGRALTRAGRGYFIYPARRKEDFEQAAEQNGLKIRTLRYVHPSREKPARWFLAECGFSRDVEEELPPLFVHDTQGEYSPEMKRIFSGEEHVPPR
jgi:tRNA1Val (adenine37-N6)-methyltransferase